jgi:hypothetical protein
MAFVCFAEEEKADYEIKTQTAKRGRQGQFAIRNAMSGASELEVRAKILMRSRLNQPCTAKQFLSPLAGLGIDVFGRIPAMNRGAIFGRPYGTGPKGRFDKIRGWRIGAFIWTRRRPAFI